MLTHVATGQAVQPGKHQAAVNDGVAAHLAGQAAGENPVEVQGVAVAHQVGERHMFFGNGAAVGVHDNIARAEVLGIGVRSGQARSESAIGQRQLKRGRVLAGKGHRHGRRRRGRQAIAAPAHHDLALVLQYHLVVLVDAHGADTGDAGFVRPAVLALKYPGERAQGVPGIDGPQELHLVIAEVGDGLFRVVLHPQRQGDVEHHLRAGQQVPEAVAHSILQVEVQRVGLHEGAGESQHIAALEGKAPGVFEHLARLQFVQVAAVLRPARAGQVHRHLGGDLRLACQLQ